MKDGPAQLRAKVASLENGIAVISRIVFPDENLPPTNLVLIADAVSVIARKDFTQEVRSLNNRIQELIGEKEKFQIESRSYKQSALFYETDASEARLALKSQQDTLTDLRRELQGYKDGVDRTVSPSNVLHIEASGDEEFARLQGFKEGCEFMRDSK